jgi:small subunit ribosomal protein S17
MPQRTLTGRVVSDKTPQLRRVEIARLVRHPKYKKFVRKKTVCHVHDEDNASSVGDQVEIIESPPLSKLKRWRLVRVVEVSREVDLAALRAARRSGATEQTEVLGTLTDGGEATASQEGSGE